MIIRNAKMGDYGAIALIEKECFAHPWSEADIEASHSLDCEFLVAVRGGEVVGYCGAQVSDGGYITNVAVSRNHRKKGVAKALISEMIRLCKLKGLPFLTLEVRVSNAPAIALYETLGFEKLGKRPNFYTDPKEDAFIYTLNF